MMDEIKKMVAKGLPITRDPYGDMAKSLNIDKKELIESINGMVGKDFEKIRAEINYEKIGYKINVLMAIRSQNDEICQFISKSKNVTHCYERYPDEKFRYNFFAMAHFRKKEELEKFLSELKTFNAEYELLRTIKKFKRGRLP